jgi:hypothetical protein
MNFTKVFALLAALAIATPWTVEARGRQPDEDTTTTDTTTSPPDDIRSDPRDAGPTEPATSGTYDSPNPNEEPTGTRGTSGAGQSGPTGPAGGY